MTNRALCLISGGFDSPVAAYRMAKAGYDLEFLFFYSLPFVRERDKDVVISCVRQLKNLLKPESNFRLFIVDNENILQKMRESADEYHTLIARRLMFKVAEKIAKKLKCEAIVTGESLAQVSSQTLDNIVALTNAVKIPILRPLLGFDKSDTIAISKEIGMFDFSKLHKDCGLGAVGKARTKAKESELKAIEKEIGAKELVAEALEKLQVLRI